MTQALLNNVDHHDLRVRVGPSAPGEHVNLALLLPTEFVAAARDFPILFRLGAEQDMHAVALLGLDANSNLFIGPDGWSARYVPATLARGPFSIVMQQRGGSTDAAEPMVHVDLADPRVSRDEGEPVFLPHGGNSPYLEHVTGALRTLYAGIQAAPRFYAALLGAALLRPVKLEVKVSDHKQYDLDDFFTIDEAVLAGLDGAALAALNADGFLAPVFAAAQSFGNLPHLIERHRAREAV